MNNQSTRKLISNVVTIILLLVSLILVTSSSRQSAFGMFWVQKKKSITQETWPNEPILLVKFKAGTQEVYPLTEFDGDDNWLEGFSAKVKNISSKNIKYISIFLTFPDTDAIGHRKSLVIHCGRLKNNTTMEKEVLIKPGEDIDLDLSPDEYAGLKRLLERGQPLKDINKLELRLESVIFADGIKWYAGNLMREDPNRPDVWRKIDKQ